MRPIYERYRQVKRLLGAAGISGDDLQLAPSIDAMRGQLHSPFTAPSAPAPRTAATRPDSAAVTKEKRSIPASVSVCVYATAGI